MTKGADNVILDRVDKARQKTTALEAQLIAFAKEGFRTLCLTLTLTLTLKLQPPSPICVHGNTSPWPTESPQSPPGLPAPLHPHSDPHSTSPIPPPINRGVAQGDSARGLHTAGGPDLVTWF